MPLTEVNDLETFWRTRASCWLISGPPNSGKTTSLVTFLEGVTRDERTGTYTIESGAERIAYIGFPGEQGISSFPAEALGDHAKVWVGSDLTDPTKPVDWAAELRSVKQVTAEILTGKHGAFDVLALDGLHKLHALYLAVATGGESARSYDFEARLYGEAWKNFMAYLHMIFRCATIKKKVFTVWDGREKDDPDAKDKDTQKHIFPELPGKGAKEIMGEFAVALYARVTGVGEGARYEWQTRPFGKVWGCGIKAPTYLLKEVKTYEPQDYKILASKLRLRTGVKEEGANG